MKRAAPSNDSEDEVTSSDRSSQRTAALGRKKAGKEKNQKSRKKFVRVSLSN